MPLFLFLHKHFCLVIHCVARLAVGDVPNFEWLCKWIEEDTRQEKELFHIVQWKVLLASIVPPNLVFQWAYLQIKSKPFVLVDNFVLVCLLILNVQKCDNASPKKMYTYMKSLVLLKTFPFETCSF